MTEEQRKAYKLLAIASLALDMLDEKVFDNSIVEDWILSARAGVNGAGMLLRRDGPLDE